MSFPISDDMAKGQIEYILFDRRCSDSIKGRKTKSFLRAEVESMHNLAMVTIKLKMKKIQRPPSSRMKYDIRHLRDAEAPSESK